MSTKCKSCKREVPDNATFCPWCDQKQVRERKKDGVIKVPEPKQLPSGSWRIYLRAEQQSVTEPTKDRCIAKAKAIRAGFVEQQKKAKDQPLLLSEAIENYITRRTLLPHLSEKPLQVLPRGQHTRAGGLAVVYKRGGRALRPKNAEKCLGVY